MTDKDDEDGILVVFTVVVDDAVAVTAATTSNYYYYYTLSLKEQLWLLVNRMESRLSDQVKLLKQLLSVSRRRLTCLSREMEECTHIVTQPQKLSLDHYINFTAKTSTWLN